MIQQEKKVKYTLTVKLKALPNGMLVNFESDEQKEEYLAKWGNRKDYHSSDKSTVKKIGTVDRKMVSHLNNLISYSGRSKSFTSDRLKTRITFDQINTLRLYNRHDYIIISSGTKWHSTNDSKVTTKLNFHISNENFFNNAIVIDMKELERLYNDIKEEWSDEANLKQVIAENSLHVNNLLIRQDMLKKGIESADKRLAFLDTFDNYKFTKEDVEMYRMAQDQQFYRGVGNDYIKNDWKDWEEVDRVSRKFARYKQAVSSYYSQYVDKDYDLSIKEVQQAKYYIERGEDEHTPYPVVRNNNDYNHVIRAYEIVTLDSLPTLDKFNKDVNTLNHLKVLIKEKEHWMKLYILSILQPTGDLFVWNRRE
tara:strand:- start:3843 stop:4940 length:1098 start_codon:yes stop_codon:yes gene_type:complete